MQTAERACEPLGVPVTIEPALAGEPFDVHELTAGLGDVLLVGHDPSFSLMLHDLTGAQARMKKGGLAASRRASSSRCCARPSSRDRQGEGAR